MTMAPFVVGDKVYVGNSGGELGVWGWLAALDVKTGKEALARATARGTDKEVMIGADFKPFYSWMAGKDLGKTSWPAGMWKTGAGAVWALGLVRPRDQLDLLRHQQPRAARAVATPRLQPVDQRGVRARRDHRHGEVGLPVHAARPVGLRRRQRERPARHHLRRQAAQGAGALRPQRLRLHDRPHHGRGAERSARSPTRTGRHGIDLKTGMPKVVAEMQPKPNVKLRNVCPPDIGGKDWQPSAFSPRTGLVYAGIFNICMDVTDHPQSYIPGTPYDGMEMTRHAGAGRQLGRVHGLGSGRRQEGLVDQGAVHDDERRARDRRRRRLLRHRRRLVSRGRREERQGALVAQARLGHHRPADDAISVPTSASTSPSIRASAARRWSARRCPAFRPAAACCTCSRINGDSPHRRRGPADRPRAGAPRRAPTAAWEASHERERRSVVPRPRCVVRPRGAARVAAAAMQGGSTAEPPPQPEPGIEAIGDVPLGDVAGAAQSTLGDAVSESVRKQSAGRAAGHDLFIKMNCAGCHGYDAKGAMGPNLTDRTGATAACRRRSSSRSTKGGRRACRHGTRPCHPRRSGSSSPTSSRSAAAIRPSQYQASVQGDRGGDNVAPEVAATLPAGPRLPADAPAEGRRPTTRRSAARRRWPAAGQQA